MNITENSSAREHVKRLTTAQQQAREQRANARQSHREQQQEKQRVFLVGKYTLEKARGNLTAWETLCHALDEVLIRKVDRGLFGLAPLPLVEEKGGNHGIDR